MTVAWDVQFATPERPLSHPRITKGVVLAKYRSRSRPFVWYPMGISGSGNPFCLCKGFLYCHAEVSERTCCHIQAYSASTLASKNVRRYLKRDGSIGEVSVEQAASWLGQTKKRQETRLKAYRAYHGAESEKEGKRAARLLVQRVKKERKPSRVLPAMPNEQLELKLTG